MFIVMASGGGNPRELQENLSNSEAQLHQVSRKGSL